MQQKITNCNRAGCHGICLVSFSGSDCEQAPGKLAARQRKSQWHGRNQGTIQERAGV
jgi:hypothetical protein